MFLPPCFYLQGMPITTPFPLKPISQQEFAEVDYVVMKHAFASQNELGRLCDELIYQNDLAARLQAAGLELVRTEVPVTVAHGDLSKTYFLDLIVRDSAVYELKALAHFPAEHDTQLLNYLFLQGVHHGKLINFSESPRDCVCYVDKVSGNGAAITRGN